MSFIEFNTGQLMPVGRDRAQGRQFRALRRKFAAAQALDALRATQYRSLRQACSLCTWGVPGGFAEPDEYRLHPLEPFVPDSP